MPVSYPPVSLTTGEQSASSEQNAASCQGDNVNVAASAATANGIAAAPPHLADQKRKLIQLQLVLLLHAYKCRTNVNQADGEAKQCELPNCSTMKQVLSHMPTCQAGKSCTVPHCSSSFTILSHWKNCVETDCLVCKPLKEALRRLQQHTATVQNQGPTSADTQRTYTALGLAFKAANDGLNMNSMVQRSQTVTQSKVNDVNPTLLNSQNQTSQLQDIIPDNSIPVKDWQQSVAPELRHSLVQKLVQTIFPTIDVSILRDNRMVNLVAYAEKVESDMYKAANSREEYYQLLAEKIYKIQTELEEKLQKEKENQ